MKKNLFFLYLFISIVMHYDIMQGYDPQCTFTPDLGGLYNNQQNKQSKFQSAFSPSPSHLKNVSPQVNPTLSYKASKENKKVGLIAGLVHRIFGWGKSKKENTIVQQSPIYVSAQHVYYPSPLLINLTQEQPYQTLQQPSVPLPTTPEISTQVLRNLQK